MAINNKKMIDAFIEKHQLPDEFNQLVKQFYQPLAQRINAKLRQGKKPLFVGVNGCQGSGKSTLSAYIAQDLSSSHALNVVVMSLDDFYLSKNDRNKLAEEIHPLLKTRGVPGTHDMQLLAQVLVKLAEKTPPIFIPKFNKATDEQYPEIHWQCIDSHVDIVILEGWCWGVPAQEEIQLQTAINQLEKQNDSRAVWRRYVNQQLKKYYQPLYQHFDYWVALQAPSFDDVYLWRLEQEKKLALKVESLTDTSQPSAVMDAEQVLDFIQYFQRLTEHGINTLPLFADTTFYLDEKRIIQNVHERVFINVLR